MSAGLVFLLGAALLQAPGAEGPSAAGVSVAAHTAVEQVTVGERFVVEVTTRGPEGTRWSFPEQPGDEAVELVLLPSDPAEPLPPGVRRYQAAVFALKDVAVPPIAIGYLLPDGPSGEAATAALPLRVASLLPKDPDQQTLADIRPPRSLVIGPAFWIALAVAIVALAAGGTWLVRRRRPPPPAPPPPPPTPPDVEALTALDRLAAGDLIARSAFREYYIELASIAKRYLERRLHAPVLEMTSAEARSFLERHPDGQAVFTPLRELAAAADQVKFARAGSQQEEARRHLETARGLVRQLEERLRPAPPPAPRDAPGRMERRGHA